MEEFWSVNMAILNIKNFPDALYKKLSAAAKNWSTLAAAGGPARWLRSVG